MRFLLFIFIFLHLYSMAQDKVVLKTGKVLNGIVVSVASEIVYFKSTDTSAAQKLKKDDILLIDAAGGRRYIFGAENSPKEKSLAGPGAFKRNSIGVQPLGIFSGRITFFYEKLNKSGKIGVGIPLSLTFDPVGAIFNEDSTMNLERIRGVKMITGLDLNFYLTQKEHSRLFVGPRIRYGTDLFLGNLEGYTIQTQVGFRFGKPDNVFSQHLSVGFGIARVLTPPTGSRLSTNQFYSWLSVNYRLSFNW